MSNMARNKFDNKFATSFGQGRRRLNIIQFKMDTFVLVTTGPYLARMLPALLLVATGLFAFGSRVVGLGAGGHGPFCL